MDPSHLTQKSQEALHDAQTKALRYGHADVDGEHLLLALLDQPDGIVARLLSQAGTDADLLRKSDEVELERRPRVSGPGVAPGQVNVTQRLSRPLVNARTRPAGSTTSTSPLSTCLLLCSKRTDDGRWPSAGGSHSTKDGFLEALAKIRGNQRVTSAMPEVAYEALAKYGPTWSLTRQAAGSTGHRARCRDPLRHPDPVEEDEEQPGADRRPRRRQDRDRRGFGAAITRGDVPEGLRDKTDLRTDLSSLGRSQTAVSSRSG
jgi:ATP-dependent Clp protease ATP-binding subunit ClpB